MTYGTGSSDAWPRLVQEIITSRSWRLLLRATVLVLACTPGAVAVAVVLFLSR
jgi:hypothetical protein